MVSVVVTVYNKEKSIKTCLESILNSTYNDLEVIVVNDKSTDKSLDIIKELADKDFRIKVINNEENIGAGASRKKGIENSKGDFISLIDGDDYISSDFIQSLVDRQKETDADIVSGGITNIWPDGRKDSKTYGNKVSEGYDRLKDYGRGDIVFLNNKLVRRSMYDKVPYSTERYCEDTPVIIPLLYYANKVAYIDNPGYFYVHTPESLTGSVTPAKHLTYVAECARRLIDFFDKESQDPFYKNMINFNQFMGYMISLRKSNAKAEDLQPYLQKFIDNVYYMIDVIVRNSLKNNINNTTNSTAK